MPSMYVQYILAIIITLYEEAMQVATYGKARS